MAEAADRVRRDGHAVSFASFCHPEAADRVRGDGHTVSFASFCHPEAADRVRRDVCACFHFVILRLKAEGSHTTMLILPEMLRPMAQHDIADKQ